MITKNKVEQEAVNKAWKTMNTWALCRYYFKETITPLQAMVIRKILFFKELGIKQISICAMTRWGKSYCISRAEALYLLKEKNKKIFFLGPQVDQARILRDYMTDVVLKCPALLKEADLSREGTEKIKKEASRTRMTFSNRNNEYRVFSTEGGGNRLMGHGIGSGGGIVNKDEAVLMDAEAFAKIGRMMGDNPDDSLEIEAYNPWHRDNVVFDHSIDPTWEKIHIGWEDAVKDGRVTKEFVEKQRRDLTTLDFQVLYESRFPTESQDQLIPYEAIEKAIREIPSNLPQVDQVVIGADIAEFGKDFSVIMDGTKHGGLFVIRGLKWYSKREVMETTGWIVKIAQDLKNVNQINVDATGMGTGVAGRLREIKRDGDIDAKIVGFVSAVVPKNTKLKKEYRNMKAKAFFDLRKLFVDGNIIIPTVIAKACPQLIKELGKMKWKPDSKARKQILDPGEAVGDTSEKKSPDFADALCYMCLTHEGMITKNLQTNK